MERYNNSYKTLNRNFYSFRIFYFFCLHENVFVCVISHRFTLSIPHFQACFHSFLFKSINHFCVFMQGMSLPRMAPI